MSRDATRVVFRSISAGRRALVEQLLDFGKVKAAGAIRKIKRFRRQWLQAPGNIAEMLALGIENQDRLDAHELSQLGAQDLSPTLLHILRKFNVELLVDAGVLVDTALVRSQLTADLLPRVISLGGELAGLIAGVLSLFEVRVAEVTSERRSRSSSRCVGGAASLCVIHPGYPDPR